MIPSLEGWPTKPKEAPSPHEVKTDPTGHQPNYILKCQLRYLKKLKSATDSSIVQFLSDFTENYQFVIHDEVQGFLKTKKSKIYDKFTATDVHIFCIVMCS